jgi:ABC-type glycerol-3-phosphate transport system permease component
MATAVQKEAVAVWGKQAVRRRQTSPKNVIIYLFLGGYCLSSLLAFAWVVAVSLKTNTEFLVSPPWSLPAVAQLDNYVLAWNRGVSTMFQNSLLVASLGTLFSVGLSCLAAYPIARIPFRWNQLVLMFFLLGIMIPYTLTAIPLYFMIENFRQQVPVDSRLILIVLYTVAGFPFNTFVMVGFYKTLPMELEEAATMDGASPWRAFWQVMLPLATPGIGSLLILNFLSWWNEFFYALIFTKDKLAYTIPVGLVFLDQQAQYTAKWVDLFAGMIISIVPVLIVFALLQELVTKGLTVGALKG